jgi:hypothetical protein
VQELGEGYASLRQEYSKSTEMLLESMNSVKAKDNQITKLTLANERLQGLCRALHANKTTPAAACESAGRESLLPHACHTPVAKATHPQVTDESDSLEGTQSIVCDSQADAHVEGATSLSACGRIANVSMPDHPGHSVTDMQADLSTALDTNGIMHQGESQHNMIGAQPDCGVLQCTEEFKVEATNQVQDLADPSEVAACVKGLEQAMVPKRIDKCGTLKALENTGPAAGLAPVRDTAEGMKPSIKWERDAKPSSGASVSPTKQGATSDDQNIGSELHVQSESDKSGV